MKTLNQWKFDDAFDFLLGNSFFFEENFITWDMSKDINEEEKSAIEYLVYFHNWKCKNRN